MKTTATTFPRPLVPEDLPVDKILVRAVTARVVAASRGRSVRPEAVAREFWPRDAATHAFIERAATTGATTTTSGWAVDLSSKAVAGFMGTLQASAAAKLIAASMQINLAPNGQIALPHSTSTGTPLWTGEGSPIPVGAAVIAAPTLGPPRKMGLIEVVSRELAQVAPDSIESIVGTLLRDGMTRALDTSIFSATAADSTRPAGILAGISATTAATGAAGAYAALTDLEALISAVVTGGGSGDVRFVCSPARALAVATYAPTLADKVFGSAAIAAGTLICVDVNSFTSMFGTDPEIEVSLSPLLHMESATPLQIATGAQGSGVLATPTQSMYQTGQIAIRALLDAAWALRVPAAVSFINAALVW